MQPAHQGRGRWDDLSDDNQRMISRHLQLGVLRRTCHLDFTFRQWQACPVQLGALRQHAGHWGGAMGGAMYDPARTEALLCQLFDLHFRLALQLELRRCAALAFLPGVHTYVLLLSFCVEVQLAYVDSSSPVFVVVSDLAPLPPACTIQVLLSSGLELVEPLPDVNCDLDVLNSSVASTTLWTLDNTPERARVFLRVPVGTSVLKLYYTLRLLQREGDSAEPKNTMNGTVWCNLSLAHPVCETAPVLLVVRACEVLSCLSAASAPRPSPPPRRCTSRRRQQKKCAKKMR